MASRTLLRRAGPKRLSMQLYRVGIPYYYNPGPSLSVHRHNFATSTTYAYATPSSQKLDMNNPLYRDLIKSIKNPWVGDLIHKLVQGNASFSGTLSGGDLDLHGTGNSLYFRIPELPPTMKGHDQDPDGIPLPPNTFRVSSVEELRSILQRILVHRASLERDENPGHDDSSTAAAASPEEWNVKEEKETSPVKPEPSSRPPQPKPDELEMPAWNPSESIDVLKSKLNQYLESGSKLIKGRVSGVKVTSILESLEQQIRKSRELLEKERSSTATWSESREKRLSERKAREVERRRRYHGSQEKSGGIEKGEKRGVDQALRTGRTTMPTEFPLSSEMEKENRAPFEKDGTQANPEASGFKPLQSETPFASYEKDIRAAQTILENLVWKIPKPAVAETVGSSNDKTPDKPETTRPDTIEPATERITLMDILNGTASSRLEKSEQKPEIPTVPSSFSHQEPRVPAVLSDEPTPSTTSSPPRTSNELLEAIAILSEQLSQAHKRISELENPSSAAPLFQRYTDHMEEALATQYSDLRDYFEERVLSETRDVAARLGSLEKTTQKILENQEAAQTRDGACIYSTEGSEPGEEPRVPVTVKLDEVDKAGIQQVVDSAVKTAVERVLVGIKKGNDENNEELVESILEGLEDFKTHGFVESVVHEVLDSEAMSRHLDQHVKIFVGQVLGELGQDQNGDLQRIVNKAVKAGTRDIEEAVKTRLADVQLKLVGMERVLRGM
ncbi:hypothetical protein TWF730_006685 [Orbilia blumenaviensis]|uniref:Uncharacterized protein n=1 Tax=Orbilia blumenaviensis TaxID=1796055 RepID=A0AAV9VHA6_9PEZI